ncbi:sigma-70 family RNA polymerase sigma factor [Thermomonospora cellulosilytica]|uniref:RNA polymerase sigma factor (Sigma-70 family) n=1 Tax=Thermomonospora cellulosilytica TaxID=1411118 RepID=A0A7W3R7B7_9ACTN|nr:sigma-70 family RNA polymerase sigma factor [Thermomonospora cellulosilytica]MBA9002339.1 RNA polymerase sigma factor (sigma-70 family) [Thermomonospora cellulosilytica]
MLYDTYAEALYDYCLSMVADPRAAGDIVHDTFIDAHRRAARMRDRSLLRVWLYGAARRRCLQRGRSRGLSWNWASGSAWLHEVAAADAGVTAGEVRELVDAALGRLDFADQEMLLLTLRHGMAAAEVAVVLGRPARRSAAQVARARERAEAAVLRELRAMSRRCRAGTAPVPAVDAAEAPGELADRTAEFAEFAETAPERREAAASSPADVRVAPVPGGRRIEDPRAGVTRRPPAGGDSGRPSRDPGPRGGRRPGGTRRPAGDRPAHRTGRRRRRGAVPPADPELARHLAECAECERRDRASAAVLLVLAPAPVLPAALRHRVLHTATDPELAGHRADIAARGGALTPEGMPRQPDMPSGYTRRWLFVGGGSAGALLTALVAIMLMNPVNSEIRFPFEPKPQPSIGDTREEAKDRRNGGDPPQAAPGPGGSGGPGGPPIAPETGRHTGQDRPADPDPSRPGEPRTPPPGPGELAVGPNEVTVDRDGAVITLRAEDGPVAWTAEPSTDRLELSVSEGVLAAGATAELVVRFKGPELLRMPGEAVVDVTDQQGNVRQIRVQWPLSLL